MNRFSWPAARFRARQTVRTRWAGYVSVALLIGLVGGIAIGAIAAARRTQSSYPRFLASTHPSDLTATIYNNDPTSWQPPAQTAARLAHLPGVRHVGTWADLLGAPLTPGGVARLDVVTNIQTMGSLGGLGFHEDRLTPVAGRLADPARSDELMITSEAARLLHAHVGQVFPFGFFTEQQSEDPGLGATKVAPHLSADLRVVGIVEQNTSVVEDDVDRLPTIVVFTPALTRRVLADPTTSAGVANYAIQLSPGVRDVAAVERAVTGSLPAGSATNFHVTSLTEARIEQAVAPESIALGAFGAIAALATLLIAAQAIARQVRLGEPDLEVLRAIGAGPAQTATDPLIGLVIAIVVGALLAAAVAIALSPLAPIGPVRSVYPDRGVDVDLTVVAIGVAVLVAVLGALALGFGVRVAPHRAARRARRADRRSRRPLAVLSAAGLPVSTALGIDFAVDSGRGRSTVPVRSTLAGTILAVAMVVTTLTFGASLDGLVSHPRLYGWNWTAILNANNGVPPAAVDLLRHDPLVAGWTGYDDGSGRVDGQTVPLLIARVGARGGADVGPPMLSGHGLGAGAQIVLGSATLARLGRRVGDEVTVGYGAPADAPVYIPPHRLRVVGTATMPAIGFSFALADHTTMGTGGVISSSIEPPAFQEATHGNDVVTAGPALVAVRMRPGVSAAASRADLARIARAGKRQLDADPRTGGGDTVAVLGVQRPAEIVNYRSMRATPALLAVGLDVGAVAALFLTLTASARRRRRVLAIMKSMGFTGRQVAAVIGWQATTTALVGVLVGVPLGVAVGRDLWTTFARAIAAVPHPVAPVGWIAVVAVGAVVVANLVAAVPARIAARTPAAAILRGE